jgi:hypothetical protein
MTFLPEHVSGDDLLWYDTQSYLLVFAAGLRPFTLAMMNC